VDRAPASGAGGRKFDPCQAHSFHKSSAAISNMIIINRHQAAIIKTPHGSEIRPLIDRTTSSIEQCSLAEEVLPAGAAVARHHHKLTEEIYYILHGAGRMTVGDEAREVKTGDAVFIPREHMHTLENTGAEPMTILLVCGPAHDFKDHHAEELNKDGQDR
jgi:mannose-6-phosphate isomerase-like protein (cupin superfamily)